MPGPTTTTISLLYRPFHSEHNAWPDKYNHFIIQTISLWTIKLTVWSYKYNHFVIIQTISLRTQCLARQIQPFCYYTPCPTNTTISLLHTWPYKITISLLHYYTDNVTTLKVQLGTIGEKIHFRVNKEWTQRITACQSKFCQCHCVCVCQ